MSTQTAGHERCEPREATLTVHKNWRRVLALGMALMILGCVAAIVPVAVSGAIVWILGGILAVGGIVQFLRAFRLSGTGGFLPAVLSATLCVLFGAVLLATPFPGLFTAVLLVVAFLVAEGAFKVLMAERLRPACHWHWLMFSGLLAMAFGVILLAAPPCAAFSMLGMLISVDLLITGGVLMMLVMATRRPEPQPK